jgi:hypothetical protein
MRSRSGPYGGTGGPYGEYGGYGGGSAAMVVRGHRDEAWGPAGLW